eukprot:8507172-Pyramimonas_sp.AAC.1
MRLVPTPCPVASPIALTRTTGSSARPRSSKSSSISRAIAVAQEQSAITELAAQSSSLMAPSAAARPDPAQAARRVLTSPGLRSEVVRPSPPPTAAAH